MDWLEDLGLNFPARLVQNRDGKMENTLFSFPAILTLLDGILLLLLGFIPNKNQNIKNIKIDLKYISIYD